MSTLINYDNTGLQVVSPTPTQQGGLALNSNFQLLAYQRRILPTHVAVQAFTISGIAPGVRVVQQVNMGTLKNPWHAIVGFFSSATSTADIQNMIIDPFTGFLNGSVAPVASTTFLSYNSSFTAMAMLSLPISSRLMVVTTDYAQAMRCMPSIGQSETFGSGAASASYAYTYAAMNVGGLFGFYAEVGALQLDANVQMESAWLVLNSDSTSTLNMAFNNHDTSRTTASHSLKVAVFE